MAKFNKENSNLTYNNSGHVAYKMSDKTRLVTEVLTTFFAEDKYYGDNSSILVDDAKKVCAKEPKFVSNLARYARKEFHMRSISHVLTCIVANTVEGKPYIKQTLKDVVERPDDLLEVLACYIEMFDKPIPNGLKKALSSNLKRFNEFQISKYSGGNKSVKFKDILMLCHTKPENNFQKELFRKILNDNLSVATRWETELSTKGNNSLVWEKLIADNKVGYMALLRNLRNIILANVNSETIEKVVAKLTNKDEILKSKQLPFRFYSAYKEVENISSSHNVFAVSKILNAIEEALEISIENMEKIPGKTVIAIDNSGSMSSRLSSKSNVSCSDVAKVLGSIADKICDESIVLTFTSGYSFTENNVKLYNFTKNPSVINRLKSFDACNGGTPMQAPFQFILNNRLDVDRIIVLSDNEVNLGDWNKKAMEAYASEIRKKLNPNFWVHGIDLQGYGTQQFYGSRFNLIAGWSEKVLTFVNLAENGIDNLVKQIENFE